MTRWAELVQFCNATGIGLVFGLNAMTRKDDHSQANFTNIDAFLGHVATNKQVGCACVHACMCVCVRARVP